MEMIKKTRDLNPTPRYVQNKPLTELSGKRLFLFDIDGTLAVGDTLIDGTRELLDYIQSIHGHACFITNNSTKSGADYVKRFSQVFQLHTTEDQFVTSGFMTITFLCRHFMGKKIFVLGTGSFVKELVSAGLRITEVYEPDIDCVVVAYDSELNYEKLIQVSRILCELDVPFYATNPDLRCPIDFGYIPDCGAICSMITQTTGKEPVYLGKPNRTMVDYCIQASGFSPRQTLVIGDRLYTDIACGINAEVDTCVVLTGEATVEDLIMTTFQPTYCFQTIKELLSECTGA